MVKKGARKEAAATSAAGDTSSPQLTVLERAEAKLKRQLRADLSQIKCKVKRTQVSIQQKKAKKAAKKERRVEREKIRKELGDKVSALVDSVLRTII